MSWLRQSRRLSPGPRFHRKPQGNRDKRGLDGREMKVEADARDKKMLRPLRRSVGLKTASQFIKRKIKPKAPWPSDALVRGRGEARRVSAARRERRPSASLTSARSVLVSSCSCSEVTLRGSSSGGPAFSPPSLVSCTSTLRSALGKRREARVGAFVKGVAA